ncbi:MAG: type II secretion system protein [Minisyncoccia bacterium]
MSSKKGFTLIELLVVIAIIGILSAVVLASLNSARNKGADAAIKSTLANARAQAELFYDKGQIYTDVCTDDEGILKMVNAVTAMGITPTCTSSASDWAFSAPLKSANATWCVDGTGVSTSTTVDSATARCN